MHLIYIYGPPASGKLTIATELSRLTGFKVFHNHLTQDLAGEIYPQLNDLRYKLVEKLRLDVFEYAAQNGTDLIYTQFYTGDDDDIAFVKNTLEVVENSGGKVDFVEITAPLDVLKARVIEETRKKFGKAHDVLELEKYLKTSKATSVEYPKTVVDSSELEAVAAAQSIIDSFRLNLL